MNETNTTPTEDVNMDLLNKIMKHINGRTLRMVCKNLSKFPVEHLRPYAQITVVHLANNRIQFLDDEFSLQFPCLVVLILRNNGLKELPQNFGCLTNLRHLDLYNNQLVHLPVDFYRLHLNWVDLNHNPLCEGLVLICQESWNSDIECRECASRLMHFYKYVNKERIAAAKRAPRRETNAIYVELENLNIESLPSEIHTNEQVQLKYSNLVYLADRSYGDVDRNTRDLDLQGSEAIKQLNSTNLLQQDFHGLAESGMSVLEHVAFGICTRAQTIRIPITCSGHGTSMLDYVAYNTATQRDSILWSLNFLCRVLCFLLFMSIVLAIIADYRVIRESVDYYVSTILSEGALNTIAKTQISIQTRVYAVTNKYGWSLPFYEYVEPEPGYWELFVYYISSMFYPVMYCFI